MDFADERWVGLKGGYGVPYDPRPAFRDLKAGRNQPEAWAELWNELHHQGDVGEASFASMSAIADLAANDKALDWNPYALAAVIEEARREKGVEVPAWLATDYREAWRQLYRAAIAALDPATEEELIRSLIAVIAHYKRQPMLARIALLTEVERSQMLEEVGWA